MMSIRPRPSMLSLLAFAFALALPGCDANTNDESPAEGRGIESVSAPASVPTATPGAVDASRLVTLGAGTTEIVYALERGAAVVATDSTSYYPPEAGGKATLGFFRTIQAEGVLAQRPSAVLASEGSGPPAALEQIKAAGVEIFEIPDVQSPEQALVRIRRVAGLLGETERGEQLVSAIERELAEVKAKVAGRPRPRVLFIYARAGGVMRVAGVGTSAAELIELSGGALASEHKGYQPLTAEAVVAAEPDVILLTTKGLGSMAGVDGVLAAPGVASTPAGRARRVLDMEDLLLLSFGPRLGEAARTLAALLHPEADL